jgi:hypothetical protein
METLPDLYVCLAIDHDKETIIVLGFELADKDRANAKAQERAKEHFGHNNAPIAVVNMMQPPERIRGQLLEFFTENDILGADATDSVRELAKSLGEMLKKLRHRGRS